MGGSATGLLFHRRERPDILLGADGATPLAFFSALQETHGRLWLEFSERQQ